MLCLLYKIKSEASVIVERTVQISALWVCSSSISTYLMSRNLTWAKSLGRWSWDLLFLYCLMNHYIWRIRKNIGFEWRPTERRVYLDYRRFKERLMWRVLLHTTRNWGCYWNMWDCWSRRIFWNNNRCCCFKIVGRIWILNNLIRFVDMVI